MNRMNKNNRKRKHASRSLKELLFSFPDEEVDQTTAGKIRSTTLTPSLRRKIEQNDEHLHPKSENETNNQSKIQQNAQDSEDGEEEMEEIESTTQELDLDNLMSNLPTSSSSKKEKMKLKKKQRRLRKKLSKQQSNYQLHQPQSNQQFYQPQSNQQFHQPQIHQSQSKQLQQLQQEEYQNNHSLENPIPEKKQEESDLSKYYLQKYRLFSKFDEGIMLDNGNSMEMIKFSF